MAKPRRGFPETIEQIKKEKPEFEATEIPTSAKGALQVFGAERQPQRSEAEKMHSAVAEVPPARRKRAKTSKSNSAIKSRYQLIIAKI